MGHLWGYLIENENRTNHSSTYAQDVENTIEVIHDFKLNLASDRMKKCYDKN